MKKTLQLFIAVVCLFSLVACGKKAETVSVNKDGTLYEVGKDISFYYPSDFVMMTQVGSEDKKNTVTFGKGNQVFYYEVEDNQFDNSPSERSELYKGELETKNVKSIEVAEPALESGLKCYEYTGKYEEAGVKFMYLVYFDDQHTYTLGYEANEKEYDKNIKQIAPYIESFTKSTGL